ncbi:malate dehydrogenase MDH3 NDAI_0E01670 [Naumovozyma dairenensis CBS 421]|uniref:Malate dehydrogenase n=1 Tax=Naumovozyma dairenensis (strain ATCC 10597 / BCRC 20456 / CBS 421 / NBRC 0211 / NRRL Y-12639) TaxID=1071378 RepID=G0WB63_NAUDC|nr:hypothetical protein NDAI_0E01670 [Naumovozyma dairenensis CBS 421]CCD24983.1 hypothetical protein NDAI_0E01670 [Naumovozyma dairenensis CBS 421]
MTKVTILGASGGVGQPLSLLLKLSPYITELSLYDLRNVEGVSKDLSHINTNSKCTGHGEIDIEKALKGANLVIIPAGVPRRPGMSRDDLFKINAKIVKSLVSYTGKFAPGARILIISNPVNSMVPIAVEQLKLMGKFQPGNVVGVTMLDLVRAETFVVDFLGEDSTLDKTKMDKDITVIGGHSGNTIVPVFLNKKLGETLKMKKCYDEFIHRVQFGGDEVVKAKDGAGSATLSMALAGYKFAEEILRSLHKAKSTMTTIPAFVYLPGISNGKEVQEKVGNKNLEYIALPVNLVYGSVASIDTTVLDNLTSEETKLLNIAVKELIGNIDKGKKFIIGASKL